ncbi:MAG: hypothetical protein FGM52_10660 [Mycobacterium sp.]|nr:hypothetical protein [Mycobacterium sp.]
MSLTGHTEWKEILIVEDEAGHSFTFSCGWGVEPPVAYVPAVADWLRCVPPWLGDRRDEVIALMQQMGHIVADSPYPDYLRH